MNKYEIKYGILLFVFLFLLPLGAYRMFVYLNAIGVRTIFQSLSIWCGITIGAWLLALFFLLLVDKFDSNVEKAFDKWGLSQSHKIEIIWNCIMLPAFLGALIFMVTLIDRPPIGQEFTFYRILALFFGFVPIGLYGFFRVKHLTRHIMEGESFRPMTELPLYLKTKWRYPFIIVVTLLMTPLFGSATIVGDLWRYIPKSRKIVVPLVLLLGFLISVVFLPLLIKEMRGPVPQGIWLYVTINLFVGVAYILIWKSIFLSKLYQQK